jgi:hypothetical protein
MVYSGMKCPIARTADSRLQEAEAQPFGHQVVCPTWYHPFPGGKQFDGAVVHHAAEGEDNGVEREVAARAVADLVVGY